jgi:release factor glutamine methyltransferase
MTTIASLLAEASQKLSVTSDTPRLDAEVLLASVRVCSRLNLIRDANEPVDADQQRCFNEFLDRRIQHEPVAYIIGETEFFSLSFLVNNSVLVPRPETELLVEEALLCADRFVGSIRILDLGTGSGCIAVALAETLKSKGRIASILAVDSSMPALDVARANAQRHKVDSMIEFRHSDWFSAVRDDESFDIMVANPPYIAFGDLKVSPELVHEPQTALYATDQGFADINKILESLFKRPQFPQVLLLEVGESQAHELALTIEKNPLAGANVVCKVLADLAGLPRIVSISFCSRA